jgi:co-chaperonin GroES (HSP10)
MARTLETLGTTVIVEVNLTKETKSSGGIIMPGMTDKESNSQALVVSVGPDVPTIKVGDWAIISRVGGEVFYLDGRSFYALQKTDVFCIIREAN